MTAFTLGALSLIGIPPFVGFLGKWYMLLGALAAHQWFAVAVLFGGTLLSAAYLLPIVYAAFFRAAPDDAEHGAHGEAPAPIVIALAVSAGATVVLFFFAEVPLALARALAGMSAPD
jgi:multicomponent Na+:H+ antiporter subunit D